MFASCQFTAVWMTVAMLMAQTVCPAMAWGCGCQQKVSSCQGGEMCCCANEAATATEKGNCPHCQPSAPSRDETEGINAHSFCNCGDFSPHHPAEQKVPDSTETGLKHLQTLMMVLQDGLSTAVVLPAAPMPCAVSSSEELTPHFRQVVLCVWLT